MRLIVGPILGRVGGGTARVLVELDDEDAALRLIFRRDDNPIAIQGRRRNCVRRRPTVLIVEGLEHGCVYDYEVCAVLSDQNHVSGGGNIDRDVCLGRGRMRVPAPEDPMRFLVVSCNRQEMARQDGIADPWLTIERKHARTSGHDKPEDIVDVVFHIGDQIYESTDDTWARGWKYMQLFQTQHRVWGMGRPKPPASDASKTGPGASNKPVSAFAVSGKDLLSVDASFGTAREAPRWDAHSAYARDTVLRVITEDYRWLYRKQWGGDTPLRRVLAALSNEMILDDHDVRNGWGIPSQDRDPETIEYVLGVCAMHAYVEYQAQLWRDVDCSDSDSPTCNIASFLPDYRILRRRGGREAVFLMDLRTPRTFAYCETAPLVGEAQFEELERLLTDPTLTHLTILASTPIVFAPASLSILAARWDLTYDAGDHWACERHASDHLRLLNDLAVWRRVITLRSDNDDNVNVSNPRDDRHLLMVGGDVHMGLQTRIFYRHPIVSRSASGGEMVNSDDLAPDQPNDRGTSHRLTFLGEQVITSPVTNRPTRSLVAALEDFILTQRFLLYDHYEVQHTNALHERNYAVIWSDPTAAAAGWQHNLFHLG